MDTHQWNQDEDYGDGRMSPVQMSSDKSRQQHQPHQESYQSSKMSQIRTSSDKSHQPYRPPPESYQSSNNHLQQQQAPAMVASSEGCTPNDDDDDDSLNDQSFETPQKSDQDYLSNSQKSIFHPKQQQQPSTGATSLERFSQKDENFLSFYQPQQWQTSVTVPPARPPSKAVHPSVHQSSHSPIPMTVKAPSKKPNPIMNYNPPHPDPEEHGTAYPEKTAVPKAEITPANADSTETSPKNVDVRRNRTKAPSSFCPSCCIS